MKQKLQLLLLKLLSVVPRTLPTGMTAFEKFAKRIILQVGPIADEDSLKFAIASQVIHLGAQRANISDRYFVLSLQKAAANQVASQIFQDIKLKQQEAIKAAQQASAEATATPAAASNDPQ